MLGVLLLKKNGAGMKKKRILLAFGTRPEAIKMAPLAVALSNDNRFEAKVCVTGQHRQMLDQIVAQFSIKPDFDLDLMQEAHRAFSMPTVLLRKGTPSSPSPRQEA